jgi:hypothetical protein
VPHGLLAFVSGPGLRFSSVRDFGTWPCDPEAAYTGTGTSVEDDEDVTVALGSESDGVQSFGQLEQFVTAGAQVRGIARGQT